jgi:hypothetical protein
MSLKSGTLPGPYEIGTLLGAGGSGPRLGLTTIPSQRFGTLMSAHRVQKTFSRILEPSRTTR